MQESLVVMISSLCHVCIVSGHPQLQLALEDTRARLPSG